MRSALTAVPWMKLRLRRYRTLRSSRARILSVVALRRRTSCAASPRLFTSSMFRSDSVVEPARAAVSFTIAACTVLIRLLRVELSRVSRGTQRK